MAALGRAVAGCDAALGIRELASPPQESGGYGVYDEDVAELMTLEQRASDSVAGCDSGVIAAAGATDAIVDAGEG